MPIETHPLLTWDPELLAHAESLEWKSRVLVEGFIQGLHRSRLRGFSAEFAQYHPYMQGDDLRYLDWRAYARLDRLYIREFEAETNLRCQVIFDASASMDYRSADVRFRKFDFAALVAAALLRLMQRQNDAFGVSIAGQKLEEHLPPRLSRLHFLRCLAALESAKIQGASDLAACLNAVGELSPRRGLMLIFTDAWDSLEGLEKGLQRLRYDHHEVCLFQVVDPRELDFDFKNSRMFEDMETGARAPVTPEWNKSRYLAAVEQHQAALRKLCLDLGVNHQLLPTASAPFMALAAFLAKRF